MGQLTGQKPEVGFSGQRGWVGTVALGRVWECQYVPPCFVEELGELKVGY